MLGSLSVRADKKPPRHVVGYDLCPRYVTRRA